ncbi:hypothetical protein SKAU_G00393950 [Synaphobranchus kaupii]|uniref:PLAC domain-containing protein n=1 Tax=Synaphobranchus kaupii TaxID=118154 RepID=A0A9Q1EC49_SYNKA|nr:hypothetical protein SKAU_G00393950 [Synaphobranchus kaupii]
MALWLQGRLVLSPRRKAAFVALFLFWGLLPEVLPQDTGTHGRPSGEPVCEGYQVDVCGVCAGDGSSCEVVSGTFSRSFLSVGYHKILEIPLGAQNIRIMETVKSKNYLALRTTGGDSVINGNWAIDRPGIFFAAGTELTYRRPNEIRSRTGESVTAPGPTAQELHLYLIYQQPGPIVFYEYTLPRQNTVIHQSAPHSEVLPLAETWLLHSADGRGHDPSDVGGNENSIGGVHPNQVPSEPLPQATDRPAAQFDPGQLSPHTWRRTGASLCSATCGTGRRQVVFTCVEQVTDAVVPEDLCEFAQRPSPLTEDCNSQPCPAFWDVGEWSACSKTCGPGAQRRQVLCRQPLGNGSLAAAAVGPLQCRRLERPETVTTCQLKICSEWQIRSEWTPCSVPCGVGQRRRVVRCVDNLGDVVTDEECNMRLRPEDVQNCDAGPCARSWFFTRWSERCSAECGEGSRSRTVVCMMNHISSLPLDSCGDERPDELTPCDLSSCQHRLEWYTGPWGQCSVECGNGTQTRTTVCLLHTNGTLGVTTPSDCAHLPRPPSARACQLKRCGAKWFSTEWSSCSRSCEGGEREGCNSHPCIPEFDENCRDMYYNCNVVVQARLCVYSYYKTACCVSCTRVSQREVQLARR